MNPPRDCAAFVSRQFAARLAFVEDECQRRPRNSRLAAIGFSGLM
jgi:hypothetical protein